jgi:hypothetical protein
MSREERRAYQRMTKKQDPYALPASGAARARQQQLERRKARRPATPTAPGAISRRFLAWALGGAVVAGLLAFSLAWPNGMPSAGYVGAGVAIGWIVIAFGARALLRRNPVRP